MEMKTQKPSDKQEGDAHIARTHIYIHTNFTPASTGNKHKHRQRNKRNTSTHTKKGTGTKERQALTNKYHKEQSNRPTWKQTSTTSRGIAVWKKSKVGKWTTHTKERVEDALLQTGNIHKMRIRGWSLCVLSVRTLILTAMRGFLIFGALSLSLCYPALQCGDRRE